VDSIKKIWSSEGVAGFYRGAVPAILQVLPYTGLIFSSHTMIKGRLIILGVGAANEKIVDILAGGAAGSISKTVVMPFDVIRYPSHLNLTARKRMQVQGPSRDRYVVSKIPALPSSLSFIGVAWNITRTEGISALYRGLTPAILKAAPSSAITFLVVGLCRKKFRKYNDDKA
jgi:solute carrier family 25 thiamine pyrophosphate transporter 19